MSEGDKPSRAVAIELATSEPESDVDMTASEIVCEGGELSRQGGEPTSSRSRSRSRRRSRSRSRDPPSRSRSRSRSRYSYSRDEQFSQSRRNIGRRQCYKAKRRIEKAKRDISSSNERKAKIAAQILTEATTTRIGRRVLGAQMEFAEEVSERTASLFQTSIANVVDSFPSGSQGRQSIVGLVTQDTSPRKRGALLRDVQSAASPRYVRKCLEIDISRISTDHFRVGMSSPHIAACEARHILMFIRSEATAKSGQRPRQNEGETLYAHMGLCRLYMKYRVSFFTYCLLEAEQNPKYVAGNFPKTLTIHEANCFAALWQSQQPGFDEQKILEETSLAEWNDLGSRGCAEYVRESTQSVRTADKFDPSKWVLVPRTWNTIKKFLANYEEEEEVEDDGEEKKKRKTKEKKEKGSATDRSTEEHGAEDKKKKKTKGRSRINLLPPNKTDAHLCPLCERGYLNAKRFQIIEEQVSSTVLALDDLKLLEEHRVLQKKVLKLEKHKEQLGHCREYVAELKERVRLDPSRALMFRDFVSWYSANGEKIIDLVFVLYRADSNGELVRTDIHNIYWGKDGGQTCYFYRDALLHLLTNTSFLQSITKLYISGDHGPAFSGRESVYFESTVHALTEKLQNREAGLTLVAAFLTSYHCPNVCDGAGALAKAMHTRHWLENGIVAEQTELQRGEHLCKMLNGLTGQPTDFARNIVAYHFKTIDQGDKVFVGCNGVPRLGKNKNTLPNLRDRCVIKYRY